MVELNKIYAGDCIQGMKSLPDNFCDCCVTSPPYFGLRDYGTASWEGGDAACAHKGEPMRTKAFINENTDSGGADVKNKENHQPYKSVCLDCGAKRVDAQIGLEETPELYVAKMVEVFTEVKRVLKKEGTLWLNLGDSYASGPTGSLGNNTGTIGGGKGQITQIGSLGRMSKIVGDLKPKDLIGIPWAVAFALRSSGWYLRQDIIWHKPNPMPESVTDRCTKAHEYIFLMSKSSKYYYDADAIKSEGLDSKDDLARYARQLWDNKSTPDKLRNGIRPRKRPNGLSTEQEKVGDFGYTSCGITGFANKRSVWTVTTKPYSEAHFATFPEDLIVDMIKAGCPEGGIVLDPFVGAWTTPLVAAKLNRKFIGYELNPEYIKIGEKRLRDHLGFFNPRY